MKQPFQFFTFLPPYAATIIVAVAILYLTLVPSPLPEDTPSLFEGADKVVHAIMFWALSTAWIFDSMRRNAFTPKRSLIILATSIAAGGAIEVAQWLMGLGRGADLYDFVADCVGATVAYWSSPRLIS